MASVSNAGGAHWPARRMHRRPLTYNMGRLPIAQWQPHGGYGGTSFPIADAELGNTSDMGDTSKLWRMSSEEKGSAPNVPVRQFMM